jgi:hypothetical protein
VQASPAAFIVFVRMAATGLPAASAGRNQLGFTNDRTGRYAFHLKARYRLWKLDRFLAAELQIADQ